VAGLVTHRQRPSSAKGVTFLTLEDETGHANIIVWKKLGEKQRRPLLRAHLMVFTGRVQRDGDVVQVLARSLEDYTP
jgi:error-prone DNA polymerase